VGTKFPRHENYQCERLVNYLIYLDFIVERQGFELCALSLNEGEGNRELFQLVADLGEARLGAGFVLVAARCSAHTDGGDRFIANLDWQAADRGYELVIEDRRIEAAARDPLGEIASRDPQLGRRVGFAAGDLSAQPARAIADDEKLG
jgi:hypothetical protein